jgi:hypothetical protein
MTDFQFDLNGLIINAEIDGSAIAAFGTHAPRLMLPVTFKFIRGAQGYAFELSSLHAEFQSDSPREPIVAADPCPLCCFARHAGPVPLYFPISHATLHWLEVIRNGGEQLSFFLNLRLVAKKLRVIERAPANTPHQYVSESSASKQGTLQIPRDIWCERVLNATHFGKIHIFEFPAAAIEQSASLRNAFAALQEAQRLHRQGFYTKAVGECRIALDKFWDERPKRLKDSWIETIGQANHKWLAEVFTAIRRGANEAHHRAPCDFSQFDSQMFIAVTSAYIAFVARTGVAEND